MDERIQRAEYRRSLQSDYEFTLDQRVDRYFRVKPPVMIASTPFSAVSAECAQQFRDGHFYGSIAMAQAVGEALVRFLCERNRFRAAKAFDVNVRNLKKRRFISNAIADSLESLWMRRNDYHHLNSNIEQDRDELEALAERKLGDLYSVEEDVFSHDISEGRLIPRHPKYWDLDGKMLKVFLNFE